MSDGNPYRIAGPALVSFSGGRTSAFMLKQILDAHGGTLPADVRVCFANTGRELEETLTFVDECSRRWGVPIVWLEYDPASPHQTCVVDHASASRDGEPFRAVIAARGFLPNPVARFCTSELKIRRVKSFMYHACGYPHWLNVVGLRADEMRRVIKLTDPARMARERWTNACPLAEAGVSRRDVAAWWREQPFDLALPNRDGVTPLGNCDLCFLKAEATIRGTIRDRPELAAWWIAREAEARPAKPSGARFRADRESYAVMRSNAERQGDLIEYLNQEGSLDCACTD